MIKTVPMNRTESSEDAHRRRMELEGARDRDTFSNTTFSTQTGQEKIDKTTEGVAAQYQGPVNGHHYRKWGNGNPLTL